MCITGRKRWRIGPLRPSRRRHSRRLGGHDVRCVQAAERGEEIRARVARVWPQDQQCRKSTGVPSLLRWIADGEMKRKKRCGLSRRAAGARHQAAAFAARRHGAANGRHELWRRQQNNQHRRAERRKPPVESRYEGFVQDVNRRTSCLSKSAVCEDSARRLNETQEHVRETASDGQRSATPRSPTQGTSDLPQSGHATFDNCHMRCLLSKRGRATLATVGKNSTK